MGVVNYISLEPISVAPNITYYDERLVVAKLGLLKRSSKRFLLNKSNYESIAPQVEANYKPITKKDKNANKNAHFTAPIECTKTIHAYSQFGAKTFSSKGMNKMTENFEQNYSTNLIAQSLSDIPQSIFGTIA